VAEPSTGPSFDHSERDRHNVARTRNLRLTAMRSFFRYVSSQEPGEVCSRSGKRRTDLVLLRLVLELGFRLMTGGLRATAQ
jgi:hypothetical protein